MTQSNSPNSSNMPDAPLPEKNFDANWEAISGEITELAAAIKALAESNTRSKPDKLAVLSLVVSAFAIISSILFGIYSTFYLYPKQVQTNINYSMAHIIVTATPNNSCINAKSCFATFSVTNQGPDTASGVTIDVFMMDIANAWSSSVRDMSRFSLQTLPSVVKVPQNLIFDNDPSAFDNVSKDNAYELTVNSLPPNRSIQVNIRLKPVVGVLNKVMDINTKLYIVSPNMQTYDYGSNFPVNLVLRKYLSKIFSIADFGVNATCANCNNVSDPVTINASRLETDFESVSLDPLDALHSIWSGTLALTYAQLRGASNVTVSNPLYLWTEPSDPTTPVDSSSQTYLGMVTTCVPTSQADNSLDTCTPSSLAIS